MITRSFKRILSIVLLASMTMLALPSQAQDTVMIHLYGDTNVRSGPGREYMIRGVVSANSDLTVTGRNDFEATDLTCIRFPSQLDAWVRVDFDGIEGWVRYCLGEDEGDVSTLPVVEASNAVIRQAYRDEVVYPSFSRDSLSSIVPEGDYMTAATRYSHIQVHKLPDVNSEIIDLLGAEAVYVTDLSEDGQWFYVEYEGYSALEGTDWFSAPQSFEGWVFHDTLRMPGNWSVDFPAK